ncbi:MAG: 30S ribosomal protein S6 [Planctomycetota bacterium]
MSETNEQHRIHNYEAMFLISQGAAVNLQEVVDFLVHAIEHHGGELHALRKWDERRLAFEIDKQKRGVYLLGYFKAHGDILTPLDRELTLSELVMRHLIVRADHMTEEQMQAADARGDLATEAQLRAEKAAKEAERVQGVSLGAPPKPADAEAPAEAPEAEDASADTEPAPAAEAPAEG